MRQFKDMLPNKRRCWKRLKNASAAGEIGMAVPAEAGGTSGADGAGACAAAAMGNSAAKSAI